MFYKVKLVYIERYMGVILDEVKLKLYCVSTNYCLPFIAKLNCFIVFFNNYEIRLDVIIIKNSIIIFLIRITKKFNNEKFMNHQLIS